MYRRIGHPGGSRRWGPEAPERLRRFKNRSPEAPGGSQEALEAQKSLLGGPEAQKIAPRGLRRPLGSPKKAKNGSKCSIFKGFGASPGTPQAVRSHPPVRQTRWFWGPGGRLQRGVLSLRTSEFWRPDLGDLEAEDPGHQYLSD